MACEHVDLGDGTTMIVCRRGGRRAPAKRCKCGKPASLLCDFPLKGRKAGKTCDRPLCSGCAERQRTTADGDTVDFCPAHARQLNLGVSDGVR